MVLWSDSILSVLGTPQSAYMSLFQRSGQAYQSVFRGGGGAEVRGELA